MILHSEIGHNRVDLDYWIARFACEPNEQYTLLPRARNELPELIQTREELAIWEANRRWLQCCKGQPVFETDLFVWTQSDYRAKPWLTRVGGVPYRDKQKPWPCFNGMPMKFVGQICFVDSRDLFDIAVPEVMLVFAASEDANMIGYYDSILVEEVKIGEPAKLASEDGIPASLFYFRHSCAEICRIEEFEMTRTKLDEYYLQEDFVEAVLLDRAFGTKIGGLDPAADSADGRFICSLGSIFPRMGVFLPEGPQPPLAPPKVESARIRIPQNVGQLSIGDCAAIIFRKEPVSGEWQSEVSKRSYP